MSVITHRPLSTAEKFIIHQANAEKEAEIEAETCYAPDITPTSESASPGPQNMAGTPYSGYNYGDMVFFRVSYAKGLWKTNVKSSADKFTNDTWRVVEDPYSDDLIIIGALVYKHTPAELTNTPKPMLNNTFEETLKITFQPVAGSACDGKNGYTQELSFVVAPPLLAASKLTGTDIDVSLYSENVYDSSLWGEQGSTFWLELKGKNDEQIVTDPISINEDDDEEHVKASPKYLCQKYGSPVTDVTWELLRGETTDRKCVNGETNIFLSDIDQVNIKYFYMERCGKKDWDVKLNYITISNDYVYFFTGYDKDYETEVDGGNGCGDHVSESVGFDLADHPWQLRCDPKLPQAYWDKLGYYKVKDKPAGPATNTCGEEIGD